MDVSFFYLLKNEFFNNYDMFFVDYIISLIVLVFFLREMIVECRKRGVLVFIDGVYVLG